VHIDFVLTREDLEMLLGQLTPLRIHIGAADGPERWIELDRPTELRLEPGVGARVRTSGRFRYTTANVPVHAEIRSVGLTLRPRVVDDGPAGMRLAFGIDIEDGDLVMVPDRVDDGIVALVNRQLTPGTTNLTWRFSDTLAAELGLTPRMQPVERLTTKVTDGEVEVDATAVRFRVRLMPALHRTGERRAQPEA
jgi:hypothetical protein